MRHRIIITKTKYEAKKKVPNNTKCIKGSLGLMLGSGVSAIAC